MPQIKTIHAIEILDSRGNPTVEATVTLDDGTIGIGSVPSGASVGTYEAVEMRDEDPNRFHGLGVLKAINNIQAIIAPRLTGMDATDQQTIDRTMIALDGTQNKEKLGANATLAVSIAVCRAAAQVDHLPIYLYLQKYRKNPTGFLKVPSPLINLLNGGKHAEDNVDFQEFIIAPATSKTYHSSLETGVKVYKSLHDLLKKNNLNSLVGDEGGYGPVLTTNSDGLSLLEQAIEVSAYKLGFDIFLGLDVAANSFYKDENYHMKDKQGDISTDEMIEFYDGLIKKYPLLYLEDPLAENDLDGWEKLSARISNKTIITGDDLTVTNPYRLQTALDKKAITGIIIKPNQIGTVIETLAVVEIAHDAGLKVIVSHRSGETNDDFIADFAVAVSADYVKFGAPARGERVSKYNRLLHIDQQLEEMGSK